MLLGREPKDFDVATNALPEEVDALFRNCRLIGRRFRLAHVRFGREIIEVATFRAAHSGEEGGIAKDGMILRDNVYGCLDDDAWRRDFTVNALYYNIRTLEVLDYTSGMSDLKSGLLRVIGDPEVRYREDPVRMLRAVRFAAKLGFRIHPDSEAPINALRALLEDIPAARIYDEILKLFMGGCALQTFELLRHYDLFGHMFPLTESALAVEEQGYPLTFLAQALANTDKRIAAGKPVTPAFLFAALLWEPVRVMAEKKSALDMSETQALQVAADAVLARQISSVSIPRRFSVPMREIWALQPRFHQRGGKRPLRFLSHPRFRAAYDFMLLRGEAGEEIQELCDWWTEIQKENPVGQQGNAAAPPLKRRRRRRRGKRTEPSAE